MKSYSPLHFQLSLKIAALNSKKTTSKVIECQRGMYTQCIELFGTLYSDPFQSVVSII